MSDDLIIPMTRLVRDPNGVAKLARETKGVIAVTSHSKVVLYLSTDKSKLQKLPPELKNVKLESTNRQFSLGSKSTDTYRHEDIYAGKYD